MSEPTGDPLSGYGITLQSVREEHLEQLRIWRNDPTISQFMLTREEITAEQQLAWFKRLVETNSQQHFVICYKEQLIGAANIKEQRGMPIVNTGLQDDLRIEPGIYLGDERFRNNVLAFAPSLLLLDYCFEQLSVSVLHATVHSDNEAALNYNQKLGYRIVATEGRWVSIELKERDYLETTTPLKQFLSRRAKPR